MTTALTTKRPSLRPQRVYVAAKDPDTGKSRTITLYGATPEQAISLIENAVKDSSVNQSSGEH